MAPTIEETAIARKTRELCQTILDEPRRQAVRQKQQMSQPLTGEEISDFEQHRDKLLKDPVARGFLDAQQELHQVQEAIVKHVSKTLELGRLPSEEDLSGGCCGHEGRSEE